MNSKSLTIHTRDNVPFLQFPMFQQSDLVKHGFSTRLGGVSKGIYKSMNLGFHRGDERSHVDENFNLFCKALDIPRDSLVFSNQVHEDILRVVGEGDTCKHANDPDYAPIVGVDGLMTDVSGITLVTSYADCVPLFFLDPVRKVIALSHAGWRGTVKRIGPKTIMEMAHLYGSKPDDILVGIGPSIGPCCFEVSEEVKIEVEKIASHDIIEKIVKNHKKNHYMIDLWTMNAELLKEVGVLSKHITITDLCTMCNPDSFFSHRATKGQRGSQVAMMMLK